MYIVGLTGGIASGKSTVGRRLRERGVPVIDADQVARAVVEPGSAVLDDIRRVFGDEVIRPDGSLNRKGLGAIVFSDSSRLEDLNRLTHPAILASVADEITALDAAGHPWACYEAALILENGLAPGLELLVAVVCDPAAQIARMAARDGFDESSARKRLAAQTTNAARREAADVVIDNDGSLEDLRAATDRLVDELNARWSKGSKGVR